MGDRKAQNWSAEEYVELGRFDERAAKSILVPISIAADALGYEQTTVRAHVRQGKLAEIVVACGDHKVKGVTLASIREALEARSARIDDLKEPLRDIIWHNGPHSIEYKKVMEGVGLSSSNPHDRRLIGAALDGLSKESFEREGFLISALVVLKSSGRPSEGFYKLARSLGLGGGKDDEAIWQAQMRLIRRWFDPHAD
ncbi:hypothetical protein [Brevundimonas viscosa]|uniref:hypothetical protein n=1 Tax=Brevundimonas viscosa TaxID=871741 RepID=UPI001160A092|nr:hypothetical protein [Brevundimonas viscosa]